MKKKTLTLCPCGSALPLEACCGRFLSRALWPETPEALMRSRYSAYVLGDMAWIRDTWAKETCPEDLTHDPSLRWLGLTVHASALQDGTHGTVEFTARARQGGMGAFRMHETSRFEKREGHWVYVDGDVDEA